MLYRQRPLPDQSGRTTMQPLVDTATIAEALAATLRADDLASLALMLIAIVAPIIPAEIERPELS